MIDVVQELRKGSSDCYVLTVGDHQELMDIVKS